MANTILIKRKTPTGAPSPASLQTGELCLVVPDKQVYGKNADGTVTLLNELGGGTPFNSYKLTSVFPSTAQANTTRVDIPGWQFPVTVGKIYRIEIIANFQSGATTTGGSMGVVLSSGSGIIKGFMKAHISQTAVATPLEQTIRAIISSSTLAGSFMTSTGVGAIISNHNWYSIMSFYCVTSGVLKVQWGTEVAASLAQLQSGSVMLVTEI